MSWALFSRPLPPLSRHAAPATDAVGGGTSVIASSLAAWEAEPPSSRAQHAIKSWRSWPACSLSSRPSKPAEGRRSWALDARFSRLATAGASRASSVPAPESLACSPEAGAAGVGGSLTPGPASQAPGALLTTGGEERGTSLNSNHSGLVAPRMNASRASKNADAWSHACKSGAQHLRTSAGACVDRKCSRPGRGAGEELLPTAGDHASCPLWGHGTVSAGAPALNPSPAHCCACTWCGMDMMGA